MSYADSYPLMYVGLAFFFVPYHGEVVCFVLFLIASGKDGHEFVVLGHWNGAFHFSFLCTFV